ncbi:MAG TPA: F0F1 ATP synthase subunit gamma [Miltoncostaeaceae bacterium]|nr:F0F1 ATP synthase subunit gamma [Miltoncostaeaceae bacterium]
MPSQRDIKRRIESVRNTRKITRAMELVASAKLRRAQDRIESLRPYARNLRGVMAQASRQSEANRAFPLLQERDEVRRAAVVTITGDRGLAGAFNVNILRAGFGADRDLRGDGADDVVYVGVGKKGSGTLRFRRMPIERTFEGFSSDPGYGEAQLIAEYLVELFTSGQVDRVLLVYNAFKSVMQQQVTVEQLLPIERQVVLDDDADDDDGEQSRALTLFEPSAEEVLARLLPVYVNTTIYRALLESAAAEHAARRSAMRNASDNAGGLITDLTLKMNRARQAAITQEILEVVAGADALQ